MKVPFDLKKVQADLDHLESLAPGDPTAKDTKSDLLQLIQGLAAAAAPWVPDNWKPVVAIVIGALLGAISSWNLKPAPTPTPPPEPAPINVVVPTATKLIYVVTPETNMDLLKGRPSGIVETHPVGTVYFWKDRNLTLDLPVVVTRENAHDVKVEPLK